MSKLLLATSQYFKKQILPTLWEWLKKTTVGQPEAKAMLLTMKTMVKAEIQIDDTMKKTGKTWG